jgi:hypothetical protein
MTKRPVYLNYLREKSFYRREDAESWLLKQKDEYKKSGQPVKTQISYENDQMWHAKILPKVD